MECICADEIVHDLLIQFLWHGNTTSTVHFTLICHMRLVDNSFILCSFELKLT